MATYLITGVSGALGSRLVARFDDHVAGDSHLIGVDRRPLRVSAPNLRFVSCDLDVSDLTSAFRDVDVVIHLAYTAGSQALRRVLEASDEAGVERVIAVSSASVLGAWPTNPVPMTEHALIRPVPGFVFAEDLAEQERLLAEWSAEHPKVAVCTLRMAMILGGGLERALAFALGGVEAYQRMGSSRPVQFLHIDDAVDAIYLAVNTSLRGLFHVAPDGFVGDATARAITGVVPRPSLPKRFAQVANRILWTVRHGEDFVAARPYLDYPWVISNDALRHVGWVPNYSSEEALVASAPEGPLVKFGTRERRRAVSSVILGSGAMSFTGTIAGVVAIVRWRRRRLRR